MRDRRIAVMGELAHDFDDPFVPAGQVMDDDDAGEFSGPRRTRVIGFALIAVVAAERHRFRLQALIKAHVGHSLFGEPNQPSE